MKKVLTLAAISMSLLVLTGCGDSDSSSIFSGSSKDVSYNVDPAKGVTCANTSDISEFNSGNYHTVDCTWYCSDYRGSDDKYVSLTFKMNGSAGWILDHEYVSDGICK